jgi:Zn-dependent protease with chaperone function
VTFEARFVVIVLAAFAWSGLAASALLPFVVRRLDRYPAAVRATLLLRLRLLPATVGAASALLATVSFVLFEPRADDETYGLVLRLLAAAPLVFVLVAGSRVWATVRATRRLTAIVRAQGRPVDLPGLTVPATAIDAEFPIVAVVGVLRPRLVVAQRVLDQVPADELAAILAHEQAHIDRHDNLARLLFTGLPDLLGLLPLSRRMATSWHEAAEHAADDAALRLGGEGRLLLAQALVRVARLAPPAAPMPLPTSALYRGEDLTRRIERLTTPPVETPAPRPWPAWAMATALVACAATLETLHELFEVAAAVLP